jgi:Pro-kumamolisin, activation domain
VGLATVGLTGAYAATAATAASAPQFVSLRDSVSPTTDHITGAYSSSHMSIELTLAPGNAGALNNALRAVYTKGTPSYHKWLAKGQFAARYAPGKAERDAIARYLTSAGLKVGRSSSQRLPGPPHRQREPAGVPAVQPRSEPVLQRHHRRRATPAGREQQRPVPDDPGYDQATGVGSPEFGPWITG